MINCILFNVEFAGISSKTLVTFILSALLTLIILPMGFLSPKRALAVDWESMMEFFSLSPFSSPLSILKAKIFNADSLSIILLAESAYIDKRRHKPRFLRASLEDAGSGRRITSKEIIWDARDKEFLIKGDYIMHSATGPERGKDARVDLDFVVTPL